MRAGHSELLPSLTLALVGGLWGAYWVPQRYLDSIGLDGTWTSFGAFAFATLGLLPIALYRWRRLVAGGWRLAAFGAFASLGLVFYTVAYQFTSIVNVLFLFYLTPIWSTLLARIVLGEPITGVRVVAIVAGLAGMALILGAGGEWPWPRNAGDWLAIAASLIWAIYAVVLRKQESTAAFENTFWFFAGGALFGLAMPFLLLADPMAGLPPPEAQATALAALVAIGWLWWAPLQIALVWATARISPGRVGILLMTEAVVGAITAALFSGESFTYGQALGGALILAAGAADTILQPRAAAATLTPKKVGETL